MKISHCQTKLKLNEVLRLNRTKVKGKKKTFSLLFFHAAPFCFRNMSLEAVEHRRKFVAHCNAVLDDELKAKVYECFSILYSWCVIMLVKYFSPCFVSTNWIPIFEFHCREDLIICVTSTHGQTNTCTKSKSADVLLLSIEWVFLIHECSVFPFHRFFKSNELSTDW